MIEAMDAGDEYSINEALGDLHETLDGSTGHHHTLSTPPRQKDTVLIGNEYDIVGRAANSRYLDLVFTALKQPGGCQPPAVHFEARPSNKESIRADVSVVMDEENFNTLGERESVFLLNIEFKRCGVLANCTFEALRELMKLASKFGDPIVGKQVITHPQQPPVTPRMDSEGTLLAEKKERINKQGVSSATYPI
jgi:hypothetical protein